MEKSYKKSCKSAIYALAIIVAGACTLAQPAFGLSCFLPSGNCGGGGVGISNQDDCSKYEISKEEYEAEYMNNCWSCSGCNDKKTNKTTYSCTLKTGSELGDWVWKNKKCCKNGNCGNCQPPLKWDDDREACVCENAGEVYHSDANMCCPSGQSPSDGMCCPSGQHNSSGHCCPRDQHYNGTECVCDEPLIGDGNGGCRSRDCAGYNLSSEYNLKCFDCEKCPDDETKIKCTAKTLSSSWEVNADTGACRLKSCSDLGYLTESESCEKNKKKTSVNGVEASDGPCYSCGDQTCEQINSSYRTSCSSSEITHPTEDAGSNGPCVTCEPDPCDSSYNQENKLDENCFSCTQCTKTGSNYENKWYCQQNIKENYIVEGTTCRLKTCKEINSDYVTTCPAGYACRDTQIDGSDGDCLTTQACTYGTAEKCKQAGEWVGTCKQDSDGCWWPETCNNAKGYAKQASDCGGGAFTTGAQAGKLGKDGSGAACYRIGCNESAGYYADLGSYDTTVFKESAYQGCGLTCKQPSCVKDITSASQCGTSGALGHKLSNAKTLKNVTCYTCEDLVCNSSYKTNVTKATCVEDTGYKLLTDTQFAGDNACSKCDIKPCEGKYKTAYQTAADCPAVSGKKVTGVTFNGKSDGKACGLCQYEDEDTCPTGFKADVTCGEGYTKFENPDHKGCYQCQCRNQGTINGKCTNCSAEGYIYIDVASNDWYCTEACPLSSQYFKPESCTWLGSSCPTGYSTEYQSQNDCGYGQVFMRNGSSKGKTCGVCTYSAGCSSGWATNVPCDTARGFKLIENIPSQPGCYQCSCQNQGIINGKCTSCVAEGYTYVKNTEGYICSGMCPLNNRYFKSCKKIDNKCSGYTQTKKLNSNCYSCSACPDDSKLYKCVENIKAGYTLTDGECKLEMCSGNKVKVICSLSNNGVLSCSSYIPYGAAYGRITRVTIRSDYEYNLYEGGEGCREGSHSLKNPRIESLYCDVYAAWGGSYNREPSRIITMDKISDNQWSCTTYQ